MPKENGWALGNEESENQTDFKKRNSKRPIYINLFTSSVIVILFAYSSSDEHRLVLKGDDLHGAFDREFTLVLALYRCAVFVRGAVFSQLSDPLAFGRG